MNIFNIMYTIAIEPLKLLFRILFMLAYMITNNYGLSIIVLSFSLNILLLPFYKKADEIQDEENRIQKKLEPGIKHIKESFKGDEQYMILDTYYRQNNYKPIYSLRSLTSLLLQIPFFIAASSFLSKLTLLNGESFLIIKDLGSPDGLFFDFNLLPILMTIINVINCLVYTKGQPLKSKMQLYTMAVIFLILLYNSPASLSFYYLLNNVFSLARNIFCKLNNKIKILSLLLIVISSFSIVYIVFVSNFTVLASIISIFLCISLLIFGIFILLKNRFPIIKCDLIHYDKYLFLIGTLFLCVLLGLLIPSQVINASPEEFLNTTTYESPIKYIIHTFELAIGIFVVWFNIFYSLVNSNIKKLASVFICSLCFCAIVNSLFFKTDLGIMSNTLVYENVFNFSIFDYLFNFVFIILLIVAVILLCKRKKELVKKLMILITVASTMLSIMNIVNINNVVKSAQNRNDSMNNNVDEIKLTMSKNGKNVVLIMLDRAISSFVPYMFFERPELLEQFDGFVFYPNTISFGNCTNLSTPSIFGGYEYTPEELNKRNEELLSKKHNEALLMLPVLFNNNNYKVTVCDPPYAGYSMIPDLSIFNEYQDINSYNTEGVFYNDGGSDLDVLNNRLLLHSIFKASPTILSKNIYNDGKYLLSISEDSYYQFFNRTYSVLEKLRDITYIDENYEKTFISFQNSTTHAPVVLDNESKKIEIDNDQYISKHITSINGETIDIENNQVAHYCVNLASFSKIGEWLDYLKESGVYDNTRIIICSDHGNELYLNKELTIDEYDLLYHNPLLMIKDFNSKGYSVSNDFMTLADIPYLLTDSIIDNPKNPFTGNALIEKEKIGKEFKVFSSDEWKIATNNGTTFIPGDWYSVHDNCLDINNWSKEKR